MSSHATERVDDTASTITGLCIEISRRPTKDVIRMVVNTQLFHSVKFLRPQDVCSSSHNESLCRKVAGWCNIPADEVDGWWPSAATSILQVMSKQRGIRMSTMKLKFMGKSQHVRVFDRHWLVYHLTYCLF